MFNLPRPAQIYILALAAIAAIVLAWSTPQLPLDQVGLLTLGLFAVMIAMADFFPITTLRTQAEVTMSMSVITACAILFGPGFAAMATFLGTLVAEIQQKRIWYRALFNTSQLLLTAASVAEVFWLLADPDRVFLNSIQDLGAMVVAGTVYYFLNNTLVPLAVALAERVPVVTVWRLAFRDVALHELAMIPLGAIIALLWQATPAAAALALLPVFVVRFSMGLVRDLTTQTRETLFALADAIDARDPYTFQHSQRVAGYAELIARQLKIPYDEIDVLVASARIHDLGKIGMPDRLLLKPGPFTPQEREEFKEHVKVGEKLLEKFPIFLLGRGIVEDHHERYDGTGYPRKKKGEEIPLGARILAVADAFDAMTSDRPYRKALTREQTIAELIRSRGTQFDSQVVDALVSTLASTPLPAGLRRPATQPQWARPLSGSRER